DGPAQDADTIGIDIRIGLGTAQRQAGDPAHRQMLLDAGHRAARIGDTARLVTAALTNSEGGLPTALGTADQEKVELLRSALAAVEAAGDDGPRRALLLATLCSENTYGTTLEERESLAREARAIAGRLGDTVIRVEVGNRLEYPLEIPDTLVERLDETA